MHDISFINLLMLQIKALILHHLYEKLNGDISKNDNKMHDIYLIFHRGNHR